MQRMKRILAVLLSGCTLFSSFPIAAFAQPLTEAATPETAQASTEVLVWEEYLYSVLPDGTAEVCGYTGTPGEEEVLIADVPEEIEGRRVTQIAQEAFAGQAELDAIRLPSTISSVGNAAFYQCADLELLAFSGDLPSFGITLVEGCSALQKVLFLQDQKSSELTALLNNDLGEEKAAAVELCLCENPDELDARWLIGTDELDTVMPATNILMDSEQESMVVSGPAKTQESSQEQDTAGERMDDADKTAGRSILYSGSCGENLDWSISNDGTLSITGTGTMNGYINRNAPWKTYSDYIKKLVLEEGVTSIGTNAFYGLSELTAIVLPQSLERIGDGAFAFCSALAGNVEIPDSVIYIGAQAFKNCVSLNGELSLPRNLSVLEEESFYGCGGLTGALQLPQNLVQIGDRALYGCSGFTGELAIPDSVESIGHGAFYGMAGIARITFGTGLRAFGGDAYYPTPTMGNMTALQQVAFTGATPPAIENESLFADCEMLERVIVPAAAYADYAEIFTAFLPGNTRLLPDQTSGDFLIQDNVLIGYFGNEAAVNVPDGVTAIGQAAFHGSRTLKELVLPNSVTEIGQQAFEGCSSLEKVSMPEALERIGAFAFEGCAALANMELPGTVRSIGESAFEGCAVWQTTLRLPELESLGARAFFGCAKMAGAELGGTLTEIGDSAFESCTAMASLILPETAQRIGARAFYRCGLTGDLTIPASVTEIAAYAFYGCSTLNGTLYIKPGSKTIGDSAFAGCSKLTAVDFGDGITAIGNEAFSNNGALSGDLILPDSITTLGESVFEGCSSLSGTLHLPDSLVELGSYCFHNCKGITGTLRIPDGVTYLPKGAFASMEGLDKLVVGTGVKDWYSASTYNSENVFYDVPFTEITLTGMHVFSSTFFRYLHPDIVYLPTAQYAAQLQSCYSLFADGNIAVRPLESQGDFVVMEDELVAYTGKETAVTVPDGVTSIGPFAFFNNRDLVSATLPDGVTSIGQGAFYNCRNLTNVGMPESLITVDSLSFSDCVALQGNLVLPDGITEIGERAFYRCGSLTGLQLPARLQDLGESAFNGCNGLTGKLVIPDKVTEIPAAAFSGCKNFTSLILGQSVAQINGSAFSNCSSLKGTLVLPDGITSLGNSAFQNCSGLTGELALPASLQTLGTDTFAGCSGLTGTLVLPDGVATLPLRVFSGMTGITALQFGSGLTQINVTRTASDSPLYGMTALEKITFPGITPPAQSVSSNFLSSLTALRTVYVPQETYSTYSAWIQQYLPSGARLLAIGTDSDFQIEEDILVAYLGDGGEVIVPEGVTAVAENAFRNSGAVTSVTLPEGVASIGDSAFENCTGLTEIQFPATLRQIGDRAFYGCSALQVADLPGELTDLGSYAFYHCTNLAEVTIPAGLFELPSYVFAGSGITSLQFPETVTTIGTSAFQGCTNLTGTLSLPAGLLELQSGAFSGCTGLIALRLPEGLTNIGARAFYGCSGLSGELRIPSTVTIIQESAFLGCSGFTGSLVLPDGLTSLGRSAFYGCSGFTGVLSVPDGITTLPNSVFANMTQITAIEFGTGLTSFAMLSIASNHPLRGMVGVTSLTFCGEEAPQWTETSGEDATLFAPLTALESVRVPGKSYGKYVRAFASSLPETVRIEVIEATPGAEFYISDGVLYAYLGAGTSAQVPYGVTTIANSAFRENATLVSITLPDSVTTIDDYAFYGCTGMTELYLPSALVTIGDFAFYECTALEGISLPQAVTELGQYAFYGCTGLRGDLVIPAALTEIGNYAFAGCSGLDGTLIVEAAERESLGQCTFQDCTSLTGLQLGEGLQALDYATFQRCRALRGTLVLPRSLTRIGSYAFSGCNNLSGTLQLPERLTSLGSYAFSGCGGITGELALPDGVDTLAAGTFSGMSGVTSIVFGAGLKEIVCPSSETGWPLYGMAGVTEVSFTGAAVPDCGDANPLAQLTALQTVYVPAETLDAYRTAFAAGLPEKVEFSSDLFRAKVANLTIDRLYSQTVVLRWDAHRSGRVTGYTVERDGVVVGQTGGCTFIDNGLSAGVDYTYHVYGNTEDGLTTGVATLTVTPREPQVLDLTVANGTDRINVDNILQIRVGDFGNLEPLDERETVGKLYYLEGGERILIGDCKLEEAQVPSDTAVYTIHWDITNLPDEEVTLLFTLTDVDGATVEFTRTFTLDHSMPKSILGFSAVADSALIHLSWLVAEEADTIGYRIYRRAEDEEQFTLLAVLSDRFDLNYIDGRIDGQTLYYYYIVGVNEIQQEGEPSDLVAASLAPDTEAPVIAELTPADGSSLKGTVTFTARAKDNYATIRTRLEYAAEEQTGETTWKLLHESAGGLCTSELDTAALPDGLLQVRAIAWDAAGNESTARIAQYTIQNGGPEAVTGLCGESTATTITLRWDEPEEMVASFSVEQKQQDGSFLPVEEARGALGVNLYDLVPDTDYTFRVIACDSLGTFGPPSEEVTVRTQADAQAPIITNLLPAPGSYTGNIEFQVTVTDAWNVQSVTVQVSTDNLDWTDIYTQTFDEPIQTRTVGCTLPLGDYEEGLLWVRAVALDGAGNQSSTGTDAPYVQYYIDHTPPEAPQSIMAAGQGGCIQISWEQGTESDLGTYSVYRCETANGEFLLLEENLQVLSWVDRTVQSDKTYYYHVVANDTAGNSSIPSAVVSAATEQDAEAPVVVSFTPASGDRLGPQQTSASLMVRDSWAVASVELEYSVDGMPYTPLKSWQNLGETSQILYFLRPADEFLDSQTLYLRARATDTAGNVGEWAEAQYLIDMVAPTLMQGSAVYSNNAVQLQWTSGGEDDLAAYRIYRRQSADESYQLLGQVAPSENRYTDTRLVRQEVTYFYQVEAVDDAGNTSRLNLGTVQLPNRNAPTPKLNCDAVMEVGVEYVFDATLSKDDKEIVAYQMDFGDGTTASGAAAIHAYHQTGDYTVTLTVTNSDGLEAALTRKVHVKERAFVGHASVQVLDESGTPVIGAPVYFDLGEEEQLIRLTDAQGKVSFDGDVGMHTVACLIADNQWLPAKKEIELLAGQETAVSLIMVKQALVEGNFEIDRMTYDEIVAAGIDVTAPENQCILKIMVHLTYGGSTVNQSFYYNTFTQETDAESIFVRSDGVIHELIARPICSGNLIINDNDEPEEGGIPGYIFSHEVSVAYLDIPVGASALKDMFDVRLHILNNASEDFPLLDNEVELHLPEGLSVMEAYNSEPDTSVSIGEIPGQTTETIRWIIRGDECGEYDLSADYSGVLGGFNVPFQARFEASEPLEVYGLSGLTLTIEIPDELDNGDFYFNVVMSNDGQADLYRPRINVGSNLIQSKMYNNFGEDVSDSMQWLVDQTESDFAPVANVSEVVQVLPAGYRLIQNYVETGETIYTTMEQRLTDYAVDFRNTYGATVKIEVKPLSYFTGALSTEVDTMGKAEQTLTDGRDALEYLMDHDQYVYWSLYKSTGDISGMMPTETDRRMWKLLGLFNGKNKFSDLLKDAKEEDIKKLLLQVMQLSVASDENSQYTWIASFFGGFNDFVNSDLGGNEGLLAISSLLEKKATGWTDSMLGSAEKTMNNALKKAVGNIFESKRWSVFKSIFEVGSESLDKVLWNEIKAVMKGEDPEIAQKILELDFSDADIWKFIRDILTSDGMDDVWKKAGLSPDFIKNILLPEEEKSNPQELALYMAAQNSLSSYITFLEAIIDNVDPKAPGGTTLKEVAEELERIMIKGTSKQDAITELLKGIKKGLTGLVDGSVAKAISGVINHVPGLGELLQANQFVGDELFHTGDRITIAQNIEYIGSMSEAICKALQKARNNYLNNKAEVQASMYMRMIHYLLQLREMGESQVADLGMAMEVAPGDFDSEEFFHFACDMSGLQSGSSWRIWRDFVEMRITLLRVQLLRSPLQQDSASLTVPTVTFDYSRGQTVQSFSDDYEYSLDGGTVWTCCTGEPIQVDQGFACVELQVRNRNAGESGESLTARLMIYPPASLSGLQVFQTQTGYRLGGLDRNRTYQVTFSETLRDYSYGDVLEHNVPAGSSEYEYATTQTFGYVYVRAMTDDQNYASYIARAPVYPMVNISVDHTGSGTVSGSGRYEYGTTVTLYPTTTSQVYQFAGWYEGGYLISNQPTLMLQAESDRQITARFDKVITGWQTDLETARAVGIPAGTPVQDVIDYFTDSGQGITARLTTADGKETDLLATGNILYLNDEPYYVVALGDVNGDAAVDMQDLDAMIDYLNCTRGLDGVYLEAGLLCRNGDIDLFDIYEAWDMLPPQEGAAS